MVALATLGRSILQTVASWCLCPFSSRIAKLHWKKTLAELENREGTFSAKSAKRDPHGEKGYNVVSIGPKMMGQKKGMRNRMTSTKLRDYARDIKLIAYYCVKTESKNDLKYEVAQIKALKNPRRYVVCKPALVKFEDS
ncbi:hypothetical protein JHK87_004392 [Glycine soja]|nr:hypothetical protein JHK87_004392 [Glycine soja]